MFNALFAAMKSMSGMSNMTHLIDNLVNVQLQGLTVELRNDAIDAIISILEAHKAEAPAVTEENQP